MASLFNHIIMQDVKRGEAESIKRRLEKLRIIKSAVAYYARIDKNGYECRYCVRCALEPLNLTLEQTPWLSMPDEFIAKYDEIDEIGIVKKDAVLNMIAKLIALL